MYNGNIAFDMKDSQLNITALEGGGVSEQEILNKIEHILVALEYAEISKDKEVITFTKYQKNRFVAKILFDRDIEKSRFSDRAVKLDSNFYYVELIYE